MTDIMFTVDPRVSLAGIDAVLPFYVKPLDVRGRTVYLGPLLNKILRGDRYPPAVARLIGEAVVLTVLIGSAFKSEGRFTLQTQTDGPVSMIVADFQAPDGVRANAQFDSARLDAFGASATPGSLMGRGHMAMTIDMGAAARQYQGLVSLDGDTIERAADRYFIQSEQIPTRVRLAVSELFECDPTGDLPRRQWRAGGILMQFLPETLERMRGADLDPGDAPAGQPSPAVEEWEDDAWTEARALMETVGDDELTAPDMSAERLLVRLFHERGVEVFAPRSLVARCRCSHRRIVSVLASFPENEIAEMIVDGRIEATCEFCGAAYHFSPQALDIRRRAIDALKTRNGHQAE